MAALVLCFRCTHASSKQHSPARSRFSTRYVEVILLDEEKKKIGESECSKDGVMYRASGYLKTGAVWSERDGKDLVEITWCPCTFKMTGQLLEDRLEGRMSTDDTIEILHLMEYLCMDKDREAECYAKLARRTMEDARKLEGWKGFRKITQVWLSLEKHVSRAGNAIMPSRKAAVDGSVLRCWEDLREKVVKERKYIESFRIYMLELLRECAGEHGISVAVTRREGHSTSRAFLMHAGAQGRCVCLERSGC